MIPSVVMQTFRFVHPKNSKLQVLNVVRCSWRTVKAGGAAPCSPAHNSYKKLDKFGPGRYTLTMSAKSLRGTPCCCLCIDYVVGDMRCHVLIQNNHESKDSFRNGIKRILCTVEVEEYRSMSKQRSIIDRLS